MANVRTSSEAIHTGLSGLTSYTDRRKPETGNFVLILVKPVGVVQDSCQW